MSNDHQRDTDPVCGMHVDPRTTDFHQQQGGETYYFCTSICRDQFLQHPERYLGDAEDDVSAMRSEGEAGVGLSSGRASEPRAFQRTSSREPTTAR